MISVLNHFGSAHKFVSEFDSWKDRVFQQWEFQTMLNFPYPDMENELFIELS